MSGDAEFVRDSSELVDRPSGEVTLLAHDDGVLALGAPSDVQLWVDQLRQVAGDAVQATGVTTAKAADLAASGSSAAAAVSAVLSNDYVRLTPASVELLRTHGAVPGANGAFRAFVQADTGKIAGQLQFHPVMFGPALAPAIQAHFAKEALKAAIASVEEAVERVEGKVEKLLALASAERIGDVLGHHQVLAHVLELVETSGSLPTTDWDSVASLGPQLVAGTEKLRAHVTAMLEALDPSAPAQDRADSLATAVEDGRVGETLQLLLVAQDSLYLWQRLRIERVRATEPEHLEAVSESARTQLRDNARMDQELIQLTASRLASYATLKPLELHRKLSARRLRKNLGSLQGDLTSFATQRHLQVVGWEDGAAPTIRDALGEVGNRVVGGGRAVRALGSKAVDTGAAGAGQAGQWLQGFERRRSWSRAEKADRPPTTDR